MRRDAARVVDASPVRAFNPDEGAQDVLRLVRSTRIPGRQREEVEDSPFAAPEKSRRAPVRYASAWEKQAASWQTPSLAFTCCGTEYAAMTQGELDLMRAAHDRRHHGPDTR